MKRRLVSLILSGSLFLGVASGFLLSEVVEKLKYPHHVPVRVVTEEDKRNAAEASKLMNETNRKLDRLIALELLVTKNPASSVPHLVKKLPKGKVYEITDEGLKIRSKEKRRDSRAAVGGPTAVK